MTFSWHLVADETGLHEDTDHWVEPDLFVLCGGQTLGERGVIDPAIGAPVKSNIEEAI